MFSSFLTVLPFALLTSLTSAAVPQGANPYELPRNTLSLHLEDSRLIDQEGRTGYIASNRQFQFDDPPQAGFLIDRGFSICDNKLALNGNTEFWRCKSGNFYNLYDQAIADYCEPIHIEIRDRDSHSNDSDVASRGENGEVNPGAAQYDTVNPLARDGKDECDGSDGIVDPRKNALTGQDEQVDSGAGAPYHSRLFQDKN